MSNFNFVTDARLANGSYTSNNTANTATIDGWKPVVVELKAGEKFSDTFGAQLYEKDGQYKVVYRGTEGNLEDWKQNGKYGQNAWSEEWGDTVAFMAKAIKQVADKHFRGDVELAKERFTTTGHSQGGFEAQLASILFGVKGTSLDGMGAVDMAKEWRTKLEDIMKKEEVGALVGQAAPTSNQFMTRVFTVVGTLGMQAGETSWAYTTKLNVLAFAINPALGASIGVTNLAAHKMEHIIAVEQLRAKGGIWKYVEVDNILADSPQQFAKAIGAQWETSANQLASNGGAVGWVKVPQDILNLSQEFGAQHAGKIEYMQSGKTVLAIAENGDTLMFDAFGNAQLVSFKGIVQTIKDYEVGGKLVSTKQIQFDDEGNALVTQSGSNFSASMSLNANGKVTSANSKTYQGTVLATESAITSQNVNGQSVQVTETVNHLAKGADIASSKELVTSGGAKIVNSTTADGHIQEDTYATVDGKQTLQSSKIISYSQAERDTAALDVSLAGLEFMQALRSGNKVQAAGSLIRLVNNAEIASNQMPTLGAIGTGFSGAVSLISALDSWGNASDGERIALTARAVLGANEVAKAFSANGQTGFLDAGKGVSALNVAGGIVALASLESTLESGNPFAIASSVMSIANAGAALMSQAAVFGPQAMIAVAVASIVFGSLFGGSVEYPSPPPAGTVEIGALADGTLGMLLKDADGKVYQTRKLTGAVVSNTGKDTDTQNWALGADVLSQRMSALIGDLQAQAAKDGTHLVLDRLPMLTVVAYPSFDRNGVDNFFFAIRFNDPGTGAQQMTAAANQDMAKQFKEMAGYAGAVVGATEWAQIQAKKAAGDAIATETEGQYVDRLSGPKEGDSVLTKAQADAQEASNRQTYSLLTLDLEGNGITRKAQQASGMSLEDVQADTTKGVTRLDVDNDGFMELTEWVGSKEAILGLDRNGDGVLNTAKELLSGGELSDAAEGLGAKRLAFFDANKDGKLDALDPYFKAFKLWLDINSDARTGVGELYGLADAGVKSINMSTGAVSFTDGQTLTLQRTQLSADVRGVAVSAVPDGQGGVLKGQYKVQQEGKDAELNMTADAATDLSDILKLVKPNSNATEAEKTQLRALAAKYGVDLSNPAALLGLGGGGNVAGSATSTTATAADVFTISQAPNADEIKKALKAFFSNINHDPDAGPNLANHVLEANEDTQVKIKTADLLAGLTGVKLVSVQEARRGAVKLDANGDVLFDPLTNQNGTGYFTYTAKDSQGRVSTAMVWLTIASVNDTPVALADVFSVKEDNTLTLAVSQLLANDTDADIATDANEKITVTAVGKASHGAVSLVNGQVVLKAEADYQGTASFEYTVSDVTGAVSKATATVTVVGENDAPVSANNVSKIAAKPDTLLRIEAATLLAYVKDVDLVYGDSLNLKQVVSVSAGNAWQQKDGSVLFKAGALGNAVLRLEVADSQGSTVVVPITINVAAANAASAAVLPGVDQASEDTTLRIGSTQVITGVVSTLNGSALIDKDGSVVFTPKLNYNGSAQVVYEVRNADGSSSQKTVDFNIAAVNDAPVLVKPLATQTMDEDGKLTVSQATLLATVSDVDIATNGQKLRVSKVSDGVNGSVVLDANGNVVFTPNKDFNGAAKFTYWVSDDAGGSVAAQANVTVRAVNDTPTPLVLKFDLLEDERRTFSNSSLIANAELVDIDSKTNGDLLKVTAVSMDGANAAKGKVSVDAAGNVSFAPTSNFYGSVSFSYTVTDSAGAKGQSTVTLNIKAVNDAPTANSSSLTLSAGIEDTVKSISFADLVKNFTDVDGDDLTVKSVTAAYGGSVTIANGQVLFTPVKDFNGTGSFSYTVADAFGATASSSATVAFSNVNDAPVAAYKRIDGRAYEDADLRIGFNELTSGAYDADGDAVSIKSVRALSNGSVWIDWNAKQVVFRGNANFNGLASFEYTLADPSGATSVAQKVDVNVKAVNDNPTVRSVTGYSVWEDGHWANNSQDPNARSWIRLNNFMGSMGANDVDRDSMSFGEFWGGNHVWEVRRDGNDALVRLEQNYAGAASFSYRVRDNQGGWADGQVSLNVMAQNDRPWLVGLPGWPGGASLGGNFNTRIYGSDVDSPASYLGAGIGSYPIHGDLSMNQSTYMYWRGKSLATATLPATWDLSYANRYGDEFSGRVGFNIDVWDHQGGWARQYVETYHQGTRASRGGKPVAIDLNGDGIKYSNLDDSKVLFDINGDGVKDLLSWTAADDGMIAFDKNGDGLIQDLDELSFLSYLTGAMTDLEGLNGFDTDKDGKLTANDDLWSKFGVWQDKNQDGVTDAGEFKGLEAWGIKSIDLTSDQMMDQVGDVYILGKSTFERTDGTKGEIADAAFRYLDAADTSGVSQPKTFNIDIEGVIRKRIEVAHNKGSSDAELSAMLQRFIADVANAGRKDVEVAGSDAAAWTDAMYADPAAVEAALKQQALTA